MPLPKIEHPIFEVYLKSLEKTVRYRPFLVKEEKLLLMAKESDDLKEISSTIKQIIRNCCLDEIDVDNLPTVHSPLSVLPFKVIFFSTRFVLVSLRFGLITGLKTLCSSILFLTGFA